MREASRWNIFGWMFTNSQSRSRSSARGVLSQQYRGLGDPDLDAGSIGKRQARFKESADDTSQPDNYFPVETAEAPLLATSVGSASTGNGSARVRIYSDDGADAESIGHDTADSEYCGEDVRVNSTDG